jgi:hypothetical protein
LFKKSLNLVWTLILPSTDDKTELNKFANCSITYIRQHKKKGPAWLVEVLVKADLTCPIFPLDETPSKRKSNATPAQRKAEETLAKRKTPKAKMPKKQEKNALAAAQSKGSAALLTCVGQSSQSSQFNMQQLLGQQQQQLSGQQQ